MNLGFSVISADIARLRHDEFVREAAHHRMIADARDGRPRSVNALRHRIGNVLVRAGEQLQGQNALRDRANGDLAGTGALRLAR